MEGSGFDVTIALQLKSQLSELVGQKELLTQQLRRSESETKNVLKELERKQCRLESLVKEVTALRARLSTPLQPLPLPEGMPPSSADVIVSLNEQLLHVLQQLHSREEALETAQNALERLQRKFAVVIHQQGVLYQEYSDGHGKWEEEERRGQEEKEAMRAEKEQNSVKIVELEVL